MLYKAYVSQSDPVTGIITTPTATYQINLWGGVLFPNGKVFRFPSTTGTARIYDPVTNTTTNATGVYPGSNAFQGGVSMPNRKVFCVPFNSTTAQQYSIINPYDYVELDINFVCSHLLILILVHGLPIFFQFYFYRVGFIYPFF
jgi:hypothetical protein